MSTLAENMFLAWSDRARAAGAEATAINQAPALFSPERQEQVVADFHRASDETRRWSA